jgi:hypothetical protein
MIFYVVGIVTQSMTQAFRVSAIQQFLGELLFVKVGNGCGHEEPYPGGDVGPRTTR